MKTYLYALRSGLCALMTLCASVAAQAALPSPNSGMTTIPSGPFIRGDANDANATHDAPTNTIYVSAFQMDTNLISYANWQQVYQWGINHGYNFDNAGAGTAATHPVQTVNWYDTVKWCNARSQMEGLTPCYYADTNLATVYTSGDIVLTTNRVNWAADGYRLPTEAEWEKAARGGLAGHRFPWGDTITHSQAWYSSSSVPPPYDLGPVNVTKTTTTPVGSFAANGYGLYDMAGNVDEWCWDWYLTNYYTNSASADPQGPAAGSSRIARGGDWISSAGALRCEARFSRKPNLPSNLVGFRCVRTANSAQQPQTISFNPIPNHVYGDGSINLTLFASGGGSSAPLIFTNTGQANISGNVLTFTGAGLVTVTANQAGDATYSAAPPVSQSFTVDKAGLTVTANDASRGFGAPNPTFTASYSGFVNGDTASAISGSPSLTTTATINSLAGNYPITASQGTLSAANYSFSFVPGTLSISPPVNSSGIVDFHSLTNLIGTNVIDLADLQAVLGSYAHTNNGGVVDLAALTSFLGTNIVDQADLNAVLARYWASFPPYISNAAFAGTNFTYAVTNFTFAVQVNTNLNNPTNWKNIGPAVFQFTDTNAVNNRDGFYRIIAPTN